MSNVSSDFLYQLVQSLDKSEKRYFKLYINRQGDGKKAYFELLFDAVSKQKEYDEQAILAKFNGESFTKRFSVTKNRLYNHILAALDSYHANNSLRARLQRSLHHVEILFKKGLNKQAEKLLKSVEKTALEEEEFSTLYDTVQWRRRLDEQTNYLSLSTEDHLQMEVRLDKALSAMTSEKEIRAIKKRLFGQLYHKGKKRNEENGEKDIDEARELLLLMDFDDSAPLRLRVQYNHTRAALHFMENDHALSLQYIELNIALLSSQEAENRFDEVILINHLSNAVYECSRLKRTKAACAHMEALRAKVASRNNTDSPIATDMITLCMTELAYFNMTDDLNSVEERLAEIETIVKRFGSAVGDIEHAGLLFSMATLYLRNGKPSQSLKALNKILNTLSINQNEDLFCYTQMLHLISHIELENKDYLHYALKSVKRFLSTRKRLHRFEESFVSMVRGMGKARDAYAEQEVMSTFVDQMRSFRKDHFERRAFEYFDFLSWAESKVDGLNKELRLSA